MPASPSRRKVLIIEEVPSIRNILFVLMAGFGCDGDMANNTQQALSMIQKEQFDAVLLYLRSAHALPEEMVSAITELRSRLLGHVLVITGEVADPHTLETLDHLAVPHIARSQISTDLWGHMQSLLNLSC